MNGTITYKLDAVGDRKASVLRVNAIHQDTAFTRGTAGAVQAQLAGLASWLGLASVELARSPWR